MPKETSLSPIIDIEHLGLDAGAHLLVKHGLQNVPVGGELHVVGNGLGWEAQWFHEPASNDESVALMGAVLSAGFMR